MNDKATTNFDAMVLKRVELAKALFSPQNHSFPLRNAKQVLRIAGELVQLASIQREEVSKSWGDK